MIFNVSFKQVVQCHNLLDVIRILIAFHTICTYQNLMSGL